MMSEMLVGFEKIGFRDSQKASRTEFGHLQTRLGLLGRSIQKVRAKFAQDLPEALEIFAVE